jgi:hypothetical protein
VSLTVGAITRSAAVRTPPIPPLGKTAAVSGARQDAQTPRKAPVAASIELVEVTPTRESALTEINALLEKVRNLPVDVGAARNRAPQAEGADFATYSTAIDRFVQSRAGENGSVFASAAGGGVSARHANAAYAAYAADAQETHTSIAVAEHATESLTVINQALADVSQARADIDASLRRLGSGG